VKVPGYIGESQIGENLIGEIPEPRKTALTPIVTSGDCIVEDN